MRRTRHYFHSPPTHAARGTAHYFTCRQPEFAGQLLAGKSWEWWVDYPSAAIRSEILQQFSPQETQGGRQPARYRAPQVIVDQRDTLGNKQVTHRESAWD